MGCAETKQEGSIGEVVDYKNVPAFNSNYPEPYPPERLRRQILDPEKCAEIDDRARRIPGGTDSAYAPLLKYLAQGSGDQVEHVTAIYYWVVAQDYDVPPAPKTKANAKNGDTPRAYVDMVREGTGDLPTFFTILCRRSGIPCVILDGLCKEEDYEVGSSERTGGRWNAVYAEKDWRLVHMDWSVLARPDRNQNSTDTQASDPDFYFMTDPAEFASFCYPESYPWQLLRDPYSKRDFYSAPCRTPRFFQLGAQIVRPKKGSTKTSNAKVDAEIAFPKRVMKQLAVTYKLVYKEDIKDDDYTGKGERQHGVPENLQNYVFMHRKSARCLFEIQLPQAGVYLFSVHAQMVPQDDDDIDDDVMQKICELKLTSTKDSDDAEPLPEAPMSGWGPGPLCRQIGLVPLSHFDGFIYIKPGESRTVRFRMLGEMSVKPVLSHDSLPLYELAEHVQGDIVDDEVIVKVKIPEDGQYALKIYARHKGDSEYEEACYYLLRQQVKLKHGEKYRDQMFRKKLEHHLVNHTSPEELRSALETFECYNVPDHGERKRTDEKLKQYWEVKYELDHAVKRRNVGNLHKWITRAKASKYEPDLRDDIEKAEHFTEYMNRLKGNQHPISRMEEPTMLEVRSFKRPPPVAHHVMASTFVLLGEEKRDLENWGYIQYQMGKPGKQTLKNRILARQPDDVSRESVDQAEQLIHPYSLQKCRDVSHGTATYYKWCHHFIHDVKQKHKEDDEEEERKRFVADEEEARNAFMDGETSCANSPGNDQRPDSRANSSNNHQRPDSRADSPGNHQRPGSGAHSHLNHKRAGSRADSHTGRPDSVSPYSHHDDTQQPRSRSQSPRDDKHPFMVDEKDRRPDTRAKRPSQMPSSDNKRKQEPVSYAGFKDYSY